MPSWCSSWLMLAAYHSFGIHDGFEDIEVTIIDNEHN